MSNPIRMISYDEPQLALGDRGLRWFAIAFAITQLVEVPIYVRALRPPHAASPRPLATRVAIAFGASLLTHPLVWFVFPFLTALLLFFLIGSLHSVPTRTLIYFVLAEGFAVLAEAAYLRRFGVRRALAWSIGANAASCAVGTIAVKLIELF